MYGSVKTVDKVMHTIQKDMPYYAKSGGGVTLSGGEPLLQFEFAYDILSASKARGINTCIETSGYVATEKLMALIPIVDLFLFDFKICDDKLMRRLVGVSNELILTNLAMLNEHGASIVLRCPIIPGINDNDHHFSKIAELVDSHKNIQSVQLLPYHDYGRSKAAHIGRSHRTNYPPAEDEIEHSWIQKLAALGCSTAEFA
jgi:pyruvate formate lyase activating enzyme